MALHAQGERILKSPGLFAAYHQGLAFFILFPAWSHFRSCSSFPKTCPTRDFFSVTWVKRSLNPAEMEELKKQGRILGADQGVDPGADPGGGVPPFRGPAPS